MQLHLHKRCKQVQQLYRAAPLHHVAPPRLNPCLAAPAHVRRAVRWCSRCEKRPPLPGRTTCGLCAPSLTSKGRPGAQSNASLSRLATYSGNPLLAGHGARVRGPR